MRLLHRSIMLFCALCTLRALAVHAAAQGTQLADKETAAREYFTDVVLLNQDGEEMRFYSDLIRERTVIMIPFFTTCTSVCPPMNRNMQKIQDWLGDRLGKDVIMMSISVDAVYDTMPRIKVYSERYHARPGWFFLTGKKEDVDVALKKVGQYVENKDDHTSIMIIGNTRTGLWKKAFALSKFEDLLRVVDSVVNDKGEGGTE